MFPCTMEGRQKYIRILKFGKFVKEDFLKVVKSFERSIEFDWECRKSVIACNPFEICLPFF